MEKKILETTIDSCKKTVEIDPKNKIAWFFMGNAYRNNGEHEKAINSYKKAIEIDPKYVEALYNMGNANRNNGTYKKAIESYAKIVEIDPKNINAWNYMGYAFEKLREYEKAIKSYENVVEIDPNEASVWKNIGYVYTEIKKYEKSIESYEMALKINPNDLGAMNNIGYAYGRLGKREKAIEILEKVVAINPKKENAQQNLAFNKNKIANSEKAKESNKKANGKDSDNKKGMNNQEFLIIKNKVQEKTENLETKTIEVKHDNVETIESDEEIILTEKFRFIRDDVFLCPEVNTKTGHQQVRLQKIDNKTGEIEFEDSIYCIHVCIALITPDEHKRYYTDPDFHEKFDEISLNIRSTSNLNEIDLSPEEKFVALKSWAEGIAEAGMNAFTVQNNIDLASGIAAPLTGTLMRFMLKIDSVFLQDYLAYVERICSVDGVVHKTSFVANFLFLLEDIRIQSFIWDDYPSIDSIVSTVLDPDPSPLLFKKHLDLLFLRDLIEPGFLNQFLIEFKKNQTAQEFSATFKFYIDQLMIRFDSSYGFEMDGLTFSKYERKMLVIGMKESSISSRREISKSIFETKYFLESFFYNYFYDDDFEILTELIKSASNDVIPFKKIVEKLIYKEWKEDCVITELLSDPKIKEPIVALLSKDLPISPSLIQKEPYVLFFIAIYKSDILHDIFNNLISSLDEDQLRSIISEIITEMRVPYDDDGYRLKSYFNKVYAIYFVNLLDEILQSTTSGSILDEASELRHIFSYASVEQKIINLGKKFGIEMNGGNVYAIITFIENFNNSLLLEDLKNLSVVQKYGLILEWESEKYLVLNQEYKFDFSKYNIDEMDCSYLRDRYQAGHYAYWEL